jgi:hypothetical protein
MPFLVLYFPFNHAFELGGVFECFVYDFAFAAGQFWFDVFDNDFAVMLAVEQGIEIPFGFYFGWFFGFASSAFEEN